MKIFFGICLLVLIGAGALLLGRQASQQAKYEGLQTVPCIDATLPIKQQFTLKISILINGNNYPLESTIGHDYGKCLHDIYTNDASGTVFVRANDTAVYNLGQFFDDWRKTFSNAQFDKYRGAVKVLVNNNPVQTVRTTPLLPNEAIQVIYSN